MTASERSAIMDRAIRRALANGWQIPFEEPITSITVDTKDVGNVPQLQPYVRIGLDGDSDYCIGLPGVLFDHDFAKTIWKDQLTPEARELVITGPEQLGLYIATGDCPSLSFTGEAWQYHLQQMVVADDPIAYLGEHFNHES